MDKFLMKIKKLVVSFNIPIFLKMQSAAALLFGTGILIHEYSNIKTTDIIMLMDFNKGYIEILALSFILAGTIFFIAYFIEFIINYIYYIKHKKEYTFCPNCNANLYKSGFKRNHIGTSYVEIICKKCGHKIYRRGLF